MSTTFRTNQKLMYANTLLNAYGDDSQNDLGARHNAACRYGYEEAIAIHLWHALRCCVLEIEAHYHCSGYVDALALLRGYWQTVQEGQHQSLGLPDISEFQRLENLFNEPSSWLHQLRTLYVQAIDCSGASVEQRTKNLNADLILRVGCISNHDMLLEIYHALQALVSDLRDIMQEY